jgi:hypothetical protein
MPTATDLVTDLPADFEVFGQAVATSMADLLGGTTGQILSKASNTNMDFTWITNDVGDITEITATSPLTGGGTSGAVTIGILSGTTSNLGAVQLSTSTSSTSTSLAATASAVKSAYDLATTADTTATAAIPKSTVTAKGSIVAASAASTPANLSVGTDYGFLQADAAQSTGLLWNNAAWTTYTPTITAASGSFTTTTATGRWTRVGKLCVVQFTVTITTNGTAGTQIIVSAPFASAAGGQAYYGVIRESNATGYMGYAVISSGGGQVFYCANYDNVYPGGNGRLVQGTISYEVA